MKVIKNTNIKISRFPQGNRRQRQYVHEKKKAKPLCIHPNSSHPPSIYISNKIESEDVFYKHS